MAKESHERLAGIDTEIDGLRHLARTSNEQLNQAMDLLGKMRLELDVEKAQVKALTLQMEQVYTYLNKNRVA